MGSLAEQLMNGVSRMVILRSRSEGRVRLAMTPGTVQPKPDEHGHDAAAGQADAAQQLIHHKGHTRHVAGILQHGEEEEQHHDDGRKLSTLPTPVKMPSMTSECTAALTFQLVRAVSTTPVRASMPISMRFWKNRPMTLKVRKNTRPMMR